jgi:large subunit ribosomal protein L31
MKPAIHPEMFKDAKTTCSTCAAVYLIPSTVQEQTVEICRACHPIYTGKQQKDLRGGRIDRFKSRMEKTAATKKEAA